MEEVRSQNSEGIEELAVKEPGNPARTEWYVRAGKHQETSTK